MPAKDRVGCKQRPDLLESLAAKDFGDALFPERAREEQRSRLRGHGVTFSELSFEGGHRLDDATLLRLAAS